MDTTTGTTGTRTFGPTHLTDLRFDGAIGGRMAVSTVVHYESGEAHPVTFVGPTTPGFPGPVLMITEYQPHGVRVSDPERFGDTFGANWVLAFYGMPKA